MTWDPPTPHQRTPYLPGPHQPPPGFYRDPYDPDRFRFFDGVTWTDRTAGPAGPTGPGGGARPPRVSPVTPSVVSWAALGWGTLVALVASFVTTFVGLFVAVAATSGEVLTGETGDALPYLFFFAAAGLWVGFAFGFHHACRRNGIGWRAGIGPGRAGWSVFAAVAAVAAQALVALVAVRLDVEPSSIELTPDLFGWVLMGAALMVGAPLFEELFFRGVMLPTFAAWWGTVPAVVAQAVLFGVVHVDQGTFGVAAITVVALALGALRVRTRSLVPCIVAHAAFNAVAFVSLLAAA